MKCPECGSEVAPGERFCGNCGAPIDVETAVPEQKEPTPSGEAEAVDATIVEAPGPLDAEVDTAAEEPAEDEQHIVSSPPLLPSADEPVPPSEAQDVQLSPAEPEAPPREEERAAPPPEEEPIVPPPEEAMVPPPPPSSVPPRQSQGTPWVWIIVAIVIVILALCCCGLAGIAWLVVQGNATGMIAPTGMTLLV